MDTHRKSRSPLPLRNPQSDSAPSVLTSHQEVTGRSAGRDGAGGESHPESRLEVRGDTGNPVSLASPSRSGRDHSSSTAREPADSAPEGRAHNSSPAQTYAYTSVLPPKPVQRQRHQRQSSPKIRWRRTYNEITEKRPRVLILDYCWDGKGDLMKCRVISYECHTVDHIKRLYRSKGRTDETILRVFHVQNHKEATKYLLEKFMIRDDVHPLVRSNFGRYVLQPKPDRRGGNPKPSSRTWDTEHDPWRGISRTSLILDYLRYYDVSGCDSNTLPPDGHEHRYSAAKAAEVKVMELNGYTADDDPSYMFDVCVQRSGIYVQYRNSTVGSTAGSETDNPYEVPLKNSRNRKPSYIPELDELDNGNAIIIFDDSMSENIYDTLIPARKGLEDRWRRLLFHLGTESNASTPNAELGFECMKAILDDYFKRGLKMAWKSLLERAYEHVSILQNKIFEEPADESRAPELWTNSAMWLVLEKTLARQNTAIEDMQAYLSKLTEGDEPQLPDNLWLKNVPDDLTKINSTIREDLVGPTAQLADLMYKSVGIRDSRHGLQLNNSLWRLSWITFIFLPLTFLVGFFGMNVDTFHDDPEIKWYFIAAVPFVVLLLVVYNTFTYLLSRARRASPYQRGVYENLFLGLAARNPDLWSRHGPRTARETKHLRIPQGIARLKWWLIRRWAHQPAEDLRRQRQLLSSKGRDDEGEDFHAFEGEDEPVATWAGFQRALIRRWTRELDRQIVPRQRRPHDEETQVLIEPPTPSQRGSTDSHRRHENVMLFGYDDTGKVAGVAPAGNGSLQDPSSETKSTGKPIPTLYSDTATDAPMAEGLELSNLSPPRPTDNGTAGFRTEPARTESDPSASMLRRPAPEPTVARYSASGVMSTPAHSSPFATVVTQGATERPAAAARMSIPTLTAVAVSALRGDAHSTSTGGGGSSGRRKGRSSVSAGSDTGSEAMIEETVEEWLAHRMGGATGRGRPVGTSGLGFGNGNAGGSGSVTGSGRRSGSLARAIGGGIDAVANPMSAFGGQFAAMGRDVDADAGQATDEDEVSPMGRAQGDGVSGATRSRGRTRFVDQAQYGSLDQGTQTDVGHRDVQTDPSAVVAIGNSQRDEDGDGVPDVVEERRQEARVRERNEERVDGAFAEHGRGSMTLY